jgi:hypothetical protein
MYIVQLTDYVNCYCRPQTRLHRNLQLSKYSRPTQRCGLWCSYIVIGKAPLLMRYLRYNHRSLLTNCVMHLHVYQITRVILNLYKYISLTNLLSLRGSLEEVENLSKTHTFYQSYFTMRNAQVVSPPPPARKTYIYFLTYPTTLTHTRCLLCSQDQQWYTTNW